MYVCADLPYWRRGCSAGPACLRGGGGERLGLGLGLQLGLGHAVVARHAIVREQLQQTVVVAKIHREVFHACARHATQHRSADPECIHTHAIILTFVSDAIAAQLQPTQAAERSDSGGGL